MLVAMWLVARSTPGLSIDIPARRLVAALSAIVGAVVAIPAVVSFRSAETTVDPREPGKASRLVVTGVYRFSRNPMYLGLLCLLFGWATWLSNVPAFLGPCAESTKPSLPSSRRPRGRRARPPPFFWRGKSTRFPRFEISPCFW